MRNYFSTCCVTLLILLWCCGLAFGNASSRKKTGDVFDPNDPIYSQVRVAWKKGGELDIYIPKEVNCRIKCPDVDMCQLGRDMLWCFDTNHDTQIDVDEFTVALFEHLSWWERKIAGSAQSQIDQFDGEDGSVRDQRISFKEVLHSTKPTCFEYAMAQKTLCDRCKKKALSKK